MCIAIGLFDTSATATSTAAPAATPSNSLQSNKDTLDSMIVPPTYEPNLAIRLFDTLATATSIATSTITPSDSL
ncbi:hypothetical protein EV426DRAFT_709975 [Tirmania nivea]|nr:hypothetical protein EV426DRAFT_709975 [Tirmania nivea]